MQLAFGSILRDGLVVGGIASATTLLLFAILFRGMYDYWEAMIIVAAPIGIAVGALAGVAAGSSPAAQSAFLGKGVMIILALVAYVLILILYLGSRV